jgi:hypothetical protein
MVSQLPNNEKTKAGTLCLHLGSVPGIFVVRTGFEPVPYDLYFIIGAYAIFIQWCRPTAASNQFRHPTNRPIFSSVERLPVLLAGLEPARL